MFRYRITANNRFMDVYIANNVNDQLLTTIRDKYADFKTKCLWFDPPYGFNVKSDVETPVDIPLFFNRWMTPDVKAVGYWGVVPLIFKWYDEASKYLPFKQDYVWAKTRHSSPLLQIKRQHENFYFHATEGWQLGVGRISGFIESGALLESWLNSDQTALVRQKLADVDVLVEAANLMGDNTWSSKDWYNYLGVEIQENESPDMRLFNPLNEPADRIPPNLIYSKAQHGWLHPTAKNVNAVHSFMSSTLVGNGDVLVIDPFAGSGVISAVALALGFNTVAIDMYDKYHDIIKHTVGDILSANGFDFKISE